MTKLFVTGTTGYIGGTVLTDLVKGYPSLDITALVRTPAQAAKINAVYPKVTTVIGDFDSHDLLVSTASASDIVLHIAGDFETGILSILSGLANRPTHRHGILIHISGSGNLIDLKNGILGSLSPKRYSDIADYAEIRELGDERFHAALERKIIKTSAELNVKTVILAPAMIYGNGTGTGSRTTFSHEYTRDVLKRGRGFLLGKGENLWSGSSVNDVSSAFLFVLDETLKELEKDGSGRIEYGPKGYYFIEAGETSARERAEFVLKYLKEAGAIQSEEIDELSAEEVGELNERGGVLYGSSSRSKADRLAALGWVAKDDWKSKVLEGVVTDLETFKKTGGFTEKVFDDAGLGITR